MLNENWLLNDLAQQYNTFITLVSAGQPLNQACINPSLTAVGWPTHLIPQLQKHLLSHPPRVIKLASQLLLAILPFNEQTILIGPFYNSVLAKSAQPITLTTPVFEQVTPVPHIEAQTLIQTLVTYFNLTHATEVTADDVLATVPLKDNFLAQEAQVKHVFAQQETQLMHNPYLQEIQALKGITAGDLDQLLASRKSFYINGIGLPYQDNLRNAKNLAVAVIAVVCRAAIQGGVHFEIAFSLSDHFINQVETKQNVLDVIQLIRQIEVEYTLLVHKTKQNNHASQHHPKVEKMKQYILSHQNEAVTVSDLAIYLDSHENYLSTLFKKFEGQTITAYILKTKIDYIEQLLIYTNKSISEIAVFTGFSSQSYFSHTFKKATGLTPNQYRQQNISH